MDTDSKLSGELEDGEIESDEEVYVPLQRPGPVATSSTPQITISEPEDEEESSSSSSDSDCGPRKPKKVKLKKKPLLNTNSAPPQRKKYDIWCQSAQEDSLTSQINKFEVKKSLNKERDVESYDFINVDRTILVPTRKRKLGGQVGNYVKDEINSNTKQNKSRGAERVILPLSTTIEDCAEDIAKDMANKLCEEKEDLLVRALDIIGKQEIVNLFEETREIEKDGGMMIMNGMRRRTPGGVLFYLLRCKDDIPRSEINKVFEEEKKEAARKHKIVSREKRKEKTLKMKKLIEASDDYPSLLSRTELAIKQFKERKDEEPNTQEDDDEVKNPPPSPATDGRENSDIEEHKINMNDVVDNKLFLESTDEEEANSMEVA